MAKYSDEDRARAVALLKAAGYPDKDGALDAVQKQTGVTDRTLRRWFKGENNPPPEKLVREKKRELGEMLGEMIELTSGVMISKLTDPSEVAKLSLRDGGVLLGILIEKQRLVQGDSTDRIEVSLDDKRQDLERRISSLAASRRSASVHSELVQ